MVYNKHSFNYYFRIMGYMRARVIARILSRIGRVASDRAQLNSKFAGVRGNEDPSVWQLHYESFLKTGWRYLSTATFVHHATDGPECPYAYVYTRKSLKQFFAQFKTVDTVVAHLPLRKYSAGRWVPLAIEKRLSSLMGWYLFAYLTK
jgi:hypothetical protein